jgi:hypothetical protein
LSAQHANQASGFEQFDIAGPGQLVADKQIAGKQGPANLVFDTGTPRPHTDRRQKDLEPSAIELPSYQLLALAVGPKGIPSEMASREK